MVLEHLTIDKLQRLLLRQQHPAIEYESPAVRSPTHDLVADEAESPLAHFLRTANGIEARLRFAPADQWVAALYYLLRTPLARQVLETLRPGKSVQISGATDQAFSMEARIDGFGIVPLSAEELVRAGFRRTRCNATVAASQPAGRTELQVRSFYPKLDGAQLKMLLRAKCLAPQ